MLAREMADFLISMTSYYPIVTMLGPRQSGKTTLVKQSFPHKPYINLEQIDARELILNDPHAFLSQHSQTGAILDEIQRAPDLISYLQVWVDAHPSKGQFILTGSHQFALHQQISQSLAGRTGICTLLPLTRKELEPLNNYSNINEYLWRGFFPRIHTDSIPPEIAYRDYLQTYIERDVRLLINIKDIITFTRFIKLCASRVGQLVNYSALANEVGVSANTVKEWLSVLAASYLIILLPPYFENFGKRVVKAPKLYFTDVGLVSYLLDNHNLTHVENNPLRGALVENLVILELYKRGLNLGMTPQIYFFRDQNGSEVDLIVKISNELIPVEIKSSQTFHRDFTKGLDYFKKLVGDRCQQGYIVYDGHLTQAIKNFQLCNWRQFGNLIFA